VKVPDSDNVIEKIHISFLKSLNEGAMKPSQAISHIIMEWNSSVLKTLSPLSDWCRWLSKKASLHLGTGRTSDLTKDVSVQSKVFCKNKTQELGRVWKLFLWKGYWHQPFPPLPFHLIWYMNMICQLCCNISKYLMYVNRNVRKYCLHHVNFVVVHVFQTEDVPSFCIWYGVW
jgi:hypothetical protein